MKLVKKGQLLDRRAEVVAAARGEFREDEPVKLLHSENFEQAINRLMGEAERRIALVGDLLLDWKEETPHGQFMALIEERIASGALRHFKSYQSANKLMVVAQAIRDGRLREDELPPEREAAYLLASLKPKEVEAARAEGIVRPETKRAEVEAFRATLKASERAQQGASQAKLERRLALLEKRIEQDQKEAADIRQRLKEMGRS